MIELGNSFDEIIVIFNLFKSLAGWLGFWIHLKVISKINAKFQFFKNVSSVLVKVIKRRCEKMPVNSVNFEGGHLKDVKSISFKVYLTTNN